MAKYIIPSINVLFLRCIGPDTRHLGRQSPIETTLAVHVLPRVPGGFSLHGSVINRIVLDKSSLSRAKSLHT